MADDVDSKSIGGNTVRVQVPRPARSINREFSGNIRRFAVFLIDVADPCEERAGDRFSIMEKL